MSACGSGGEGGRGGAGGVPGGAPGTPGGIGGGAGGAPGGGAGGRGGVWFAKIAGFCMRPLRAGARGVGRVGSGGGGSRFGSMALTRAAAVQEVDRRGLIRVGHQLVVIEPQL